MVNLFKSTILLLTVLFFSFNTLFAQKEYNQEKYSQVRIYTTIPSDFQKIQDAGLYLDGGVHKQGLYFETWLSRTEINL